MSFGDHLEELRTCLIRALLGVAAAGLVTFPFGNHIVVWLARPYLQAQYALGYSPNLYAFDFGAGFSTWMMVSAIAALILAAPWVLWQAWVFVSAGLYEHERRAVRMMWPFSVAMSLVGVAFGYFVLLPVTSFFFLNLASAYPVVDVGTPGLMGGLLGQRPAEVTGSDAPALQLPVLREDPATPGEGQVWINALDGKLKTFFAGRVRVLGTQPDSVLTAYPDVGRYITSAAFIFLGVVLAFQLPVVMFVLGKIGLVDPAWIARYRKYAVFICVIVAAVLTPADVLSMCLLFFPLYALFELGLVLMRATYRRSDEM